MEVELNIAQRVTVMGSLCLATMTGGALAEPGRITEDESRVAATAASSGTCGNLATVDFKTDDSLNASTTSTNFVDVPNAKISFTQGSPGCVIVTFSAESWAPSSRLTLIRARLDSSTTAQPGSVQFSGDDDENNNGKWARAHGFTLVFPSVSSGSHNVQIQYESWTGGRVFLYKHTTTIQHP
jgi:hypothetical protein